jgi:hypothetical protein
MKNYSQQKYIKEAEKSHGDAEPHSKTRAIAATGSYVYLYKLQAYIKMYACISSNNML